MDNEKPSKKTKAKHTCDWCNSSENIRYHDCVPDRWGHYYFCETDFCSDFYHDYVYSNDFTHGLPHYLKAKPITEPRRCLFCGYKGLQVVNYPYPKPFDNIYCKNDSCYVNYLRFMREYDSEEKVVNDIPYVFRPAVYNTLKNVPNIDSLPIIWRKKPLPCEENV